MNRDELLANIQLLQEQEKILAQNIELLNVQLSELGVAKITIQSLGEQKKGDEILVPIGAGNFLKTTLLETSKLISGIGADIAVEKSLEDAVQVLDVRIEEIRKKISENQKALQQIDSKLRELVKIYQEKGEKDV